LECVVCGARAREWITLAVLNESVAVCSERCQRRFIHDPVGYLGAFTGVADPERAHMPLPRRDSR
jgi:hypothetical protein